MCKVKNLLKMSHYEYWLILWKVTSFDKMSKGFVRLCTVRDP